MTNTITPPVFSLIGYCDTRWEHEHRLITDGETAYAYAASGTDTDAVFRDGDLVSIDCQAPNPRSGEPCDGRIEWRLDEEEPAADADAVNLLTRYGTQVER